MSWDQAIYSFTDGGQPPTPTRTPTSATFAPISFETPKQDSSFFDPRVTWNTEDPCATIPDFLKPPKYLSFTTPSQSPLIERNSKRLSTEQNIEDKIASHVSDQTPNPDPVLHSVETSRQHSSSPTRTNCHGGTRPTSAKSKDGMADGMDSTMCSAGSMQTPPPTSTSASKRNLQQFQIVKAGKDSSVNPRRMSTPSLGRSNQLDNQTSQVEESPLRLSSLQFSPEGFDFATNGTATAPAYPQHKLFWDPGPSTDGINLDFQGDDSFTLGSNPQKALNLFSPSVDHTSSSQLPQATPFYDLDMDGNDMMEVAMSVNADGSSRANLFPPTGLMINGRSLPKFSGTAVDPSLLFSSPSQSLAPTISTHINQNDTLQPYANQVQDAQLEKAQTLDRKAKRRKAVQDDSPAVKVAIQALRGEDNFHDDKENDTDPSVSVPRSSLSKVKRVSLQSSTVSKRSKSAKQIHNFKQKHPAVEQSKKRTAVTLTIDEYGRAKTQRQTVSEDAHLERNKVSMTTASGESETASSSDEDAIFHSQHQSFSFSQQKPRKPKLARFVTERTHSQKSSYASTLTSNNTYGNQKVRRNTDEHTHSGIPLDMGNPEKSEMNRRLDRALSSTTISDDVESDRSIVQQMDIQSESESLTSDDDNGDAQYELKKILRSRVHPVSNMIASAGKASSTYRHGFNTDGQLPPSSHLARYSSAQEQTQTIVDDISPTTLTDPDLATPSSGRGSYIGEITRCVCHRTDSKGELMISCDSCKKWLHVACIGLQRHKIPQVYLCIFCTGHTPKVRGGRVRGPLKTALPTTNSTLQHKPGL